MDAERGQQLVGNCGRGGRHALRVFEDQPLERGVGVAVAPAGNVVDLGRVDSPVVCLPIAEVSAPRAADHTCGRLNCQALERQVELTPALDAQFERGHGEQDASMMCHNAKWVDDLAEASLRIPRRQSNDEPVTNRLKWDARHVEPPGEQTQTPRDGAGLPDVTPGKTSVPHSMAGRPCRRT